MRIVEVNSDKTIKKFLRLPYLIYKEDPVWIPPLEKDIEGVFDKKKNKYFRHGEITRWILLSDSNDVIGRVAAFINRKTSNTFKQPTGGMGFFECINDRSAAFTLFDKCKEWLTERGMEAMDGPVNFGERDRWWGLLIESHSEPNYCSNHNPMYYRELFEAYGFKSYFEQYTYAMKVEDQLPEKYYEKSKRIESNPNYHFEHLSKKEWVKYAEDFRIIYNKAWVKHAGVKEMAKEQAIAIMRSLKPVLDEKIMWFAYHNNEPVGFFIMIPELNQIFKYVNGKLNWLGKLKFIWHKWRKTCKKMLGLIFGIVPEHQKKGVEGAMIIAAAKIIQPLKRYEILEMNWVGDFNPKMITVCESLGAHIVKKHITYRKLFDEDAIFERAPVIE